MRLKDYRERVVILLFILGAQLDGFYVVTFNLAIPPNFFQSPLITMMLLSGNHVSYRVASSKFIQLTGNRSIYQYRIPQNSGILFQYQSKFRRWFSKFKNRNGGNRLSLLNRGCIPMYDKNLTVSRCKWLLDTLGHTILATENKQNHLRFESRDELSFNPSRSLRTGHMICLSQITR